MKLETELDTWLWLAKLFAESHNGSVHICSVRRDCLCGCVSTLHYNNVIDDALMTALYQRIYVEKCAVNNQRAPDYSAYIYPLDSEGAKQRGKKISLISRDRICRRKADCLPCKLIQD